MQAPLPDNPVVALENVEIVRACFEDWRRLAAAADIDGLRPYFEDYFDDDVWVDFGTRTPDSVPGHGTHVMRRWAEYSFPRWKEAEANMRDEASEFIDLGDSVAVPCRATTEIYGHTMETRFTYLYRLVDGKVVSLTMHETLDEALSAAQSRSQPK